MEIKLDRKKDYITKSDHKEQIMKYLSWKIKPFALYHEIREISRIFNFSPEEIESILKELEDENKIFPLTAEEKSSKTSFPHLFPAFSLK